MRINLKFCDIHLLLFKVCHQNFFKENLKISSLKHLYLKRAFLPAGDPISIFWPMFSLFSFIFIKRHIFFSNISRKSNWYLKNNYFFYTILKEKELQNIFSLQGAVKKTINKKINKLKVKSFRKKYPFSSKKKLTSVK